MQKPIYEILLIKLHVFNKLYLCGVQAPTISLKMSNLSHRFVKIRIFDEKLPIKWKKWTLTLCIISFRRKNLAPVLREVTTGRIFRILTYFFGDIFRLRFFSVNFSKVFELISLAYHVSFFLYTRSARM